jgi:hypothetical protein
MEQPHRREDNGAAVPGDPLGEPSHHERTHLGDPREVAVDVDDAEVVVQRGLGDEEVGNVDAMPQLVMVSEITLEPKRALEVVVRSRYQLDAAT